MSGINIMILVLIFSGIIAYIGDRIGMKAGKKRVSLFGLRPRYSSIIITVMTGILIALLTISILLFTYTNLRQALFNINDVLDRLQNLNQKLEERDQELEQLKNEIDQKTIELEELSQQRDQLTTELENTEQEYEQTRTDLNEAHQEIEQLKKTREELQKNIALLEEEKSTLEEQVNELNQRISALTKDYEEVKELASQYRTGMVYYMGKNIVYQKGDIVYSKVLEAGQSQDKIIEDLNKMLDEANEVAKKKDIKVDEQTGRALRVQYEDISNVAKILFNMDKGQKVIVSLVASFNVPEGDWLSVNFLLNRDFIVFNKGDVIASKVINASLTTTEIEKELEGLLDTINGKAIQKGILPDSQGQVGSLDFSEFYTLLNRIKSIEGEVKVEVIATENIWREDRLGDNIDFNIQSPIKGDINNNANGN
ncbi:MAG TPA: DUF3084 domain-containing protein [Halanaerobiales bacterium]|nr:DUF3084 domain-containing protein [Halanaerobiales bacterium]